MLVEGKKALVTGSGRGIGRGIAQLLAEEGADVGINDLERNEAAEETLKLVGDTGRKVSWHQADVSTTEGINRMIDEFIETHGRIDIVVNNAVSTHDKPFLEITEDAWDTELAIALKGYFLCSQRAAREMVKQGDGGRIVCISSVHAIRAWRCGSDLRCLQGRPVAYGEEHRARSPRSQHKRQLHPARLHRQPLAASRGGVQARQDRPRRTRLALDSMQPWWPSPGYRQGGAIPVFRIERLCQRRVGHRRWWFAGRWLT